MLMILVAYNNNFDPADREMQSNMQISRMSDVDM